MKARYLFLLPGALLVNSFGQTPPDQILLKDYQPRSIFRIPETRVEKARYAVIDVHSHDYAPTDADVDRWMRTMDEVGLEKTFILSGSTGAKFDAIRAKYRRHPNRFAVWCGIDYTGLNQPGFGPAAMAELERCHKAGAAGVGELLLRPQPSRRDARQVSEPLCGYRGASFDGDPRDT